MNHSRVFVTGAYGFLGQHLVRALCEYEDIDVYQARHSTLPSFGCNLLVPEHIDNVFSNSGPLDYVFHLAGYNGGIAFNAKEPARIFADNTIMALNVMEACRRHKVKKVVSVVASCAYPAMTQKFYDNAWPTGQEACTEEPREICPEYDFLEGPPHDSVACHGYAKRNLQLASAFYRKQYGLNAVCACPTTLYGPGDSFDPERTKVMGAMVKRFVDAADDKAPTVSVWGSGNPMREFLYVTDAAKLLIETMLHYDDSELPLNLGTGQEVSIMGLAALVADAAGFEGTISFDNSKPDGQYRKRLDTARMNLALPPMEFTSLNEGIRQTVQYYRETKHARLAG
jgi:nucleoside-diphosphate-sugar epimerase